MTDIKKSVISPPPGQIPNDQMGWAWYTKWLDSLRVRAGGNGDPFVIPAFFKADLPSASEWNDQSTTGATQFGSIVFVIDDALGPLLAFADGSTWRRANNLTPVA